jgi:hypothetical protein
MNHDPPLSNECTALGFQKLQGHSLKLKEAEGICLPIFHKMKIVTYCEYAQYFQKHTAKLSAPSSLQGATIQNMHIHSPPSIDNAGLSFM